MKNWLITRILVLVSASVLLFRCNHPPQLIKTDCKCPLERHMTSENGHRVDSITYGRGLSAGVEVDIPLIRKMIEGKIDLSGDFHRADAQVENTYWEILDGNPEITQYANLYWATACALYEIACEDKTISDIDRQTEKRQIIRDYDNRLVEIIDRSRSRDIKQIGEENLTKKSTSVEPVRNEIARITPVKKTTGNSATLNYFLTQDPTDIAITQLGDKSHKDLSIALATWLNSRGYRTNNAFFHPDFLGKYQTQLKNADEKLLENIGANRLTNCVCFFDQQTQLRESSLAGEKMITAILSAKLTFFNLIEHRQQVIPIELRGAGINIARAFENIEHKLAFEFAALENNFTPCR